MRNVILIGGAGYVGTVIAEELLRKSFNVTILDNFIYKNFNSIKPVSYTHLTLPTT